MDFRDIKIKRLLPKLPSGAPAADRQQQRPTAPEPRRRLLRRPKLDPWDVLAACNRLAKLLARDLAVGQPDNIPLRGYYLNILV